MTIFVIIIFILIIYKIISFFWNLSKLRKSIEKRLENIEFMLKKHEEVTDNDNN